VEQSTGEGIKVVVVVVVVVVSETKVSGYRYQIICLQILEATAIFNV
jgi:hypothetical protein